MRSKSKVSIIISCQIALIFGSFITLAIFESQTALAGYSINIAGKNRFLASQFIDEIKDYAYLKNPEANPEEKFIALEENIFLLKNGGMLDENQIPKLDFKFEQDWLTVHENFLRLKTEYSNFKERENYNLSYLDMIPLELELNLFIQASNNLVVKMGEDHKILADEFVLLQIIFLTVNVGVHIGLIFLIISIFQKEFKKSQKILKLATIGKLAAILSHEMRTPLSNLNISLKLIDKKITEKSDREKLELMTKSIDRLSYQINNVMDFVKTKEPILDIWKLNLILEDSINQLKIPNSIKIILPEENLMIKCDKHQFEMLFVNLIKNSLESIKEDGFIKIYAKESPKAITIKIEDSGPGIPEKYLSLIFEPLVTLKNSGTGLGLATCKNIVESHGGTITVENNPTTFTILLPQSIEKE